MTDHEDRIDGYLERHLLDFLDDVDRYARKHELSDEAIKVILDRLDVELGDAWLEYVSQG